MTSWWVLRTVVAGLVLGVAVGVIVEVLIVNQHYAPDLWELGAVRGARTALSLGLVLVFFWWRASQYEEDLVDD